MELPIAELSSGLKLSRRLEASLEEMVFGLRSESKPLMARLRLRQALGPDQALKAQASPEVQPVWMPAAESAVDSAIALQAQR